MRVQITNDHRTEPRCFREDGEIVFCGYFSGEKDCGLVFYDQDGKDPIRVMLPESTRIGRLYSVKIKGIPEDHDRYRLLDGKNETPDPYAFRLYGLSDFSEAPDPERIFGGVFSDSPVNMLLQTTKDRIRTTTPPEDDFIYLMHVRGFTMSPTSGVPKKHRGTFLGILDKIDHIASLGATAIELMPAYEMVAWEYFDSELTGEEQKERINYWGYTKGYYFAPRSAYAAGDPCQEFRTLVAALHKRGIALIMQFWFPHDYPAALLTAVLRHWVKFYGVDGFHLIGGGLNVEIYASDPVLSGIRMYYESVDTGRLPSSAGHSGGAERTVSLYRDDFLLAVRHYLKGDDHSLPAFFGALIQNNEKHGVVNYLASYDGFRLYDSVSYEHRVNEANGEGGKDGIADNVTWNCGTAGKTRKQSVLKLRRKQIFNALTMLFCAQGTPMIYSGDEFLDTQDGNNNPYCLDDPVSWVNWRSESNALGEAAEEFIRFLIRYRRTHRMLCQPAPLRLMDYKAFGFPDLSAHGVDAWQPDFNGFTHCVGMLYCNLYAKEQNPAFLYCIYNSHWESRRFALPAVPKPLSWTVVVDTGKTGEEHREYPIRGEKSVRLEARSCMILEARGRFHMAGGEERTPF